MYILLYIYEYYQKLFAIHSIKNQLFIKKYWRSCILKDIVYFVMIWRYQQVNDLFELRKISGDA